MRTRGLVWGLAAMMFIAAVAGASSAEAQAGSSPGSVHLGVYYGIGAGGEYEADINGGLLGDTTVTADADVSLALGVYGEVALLKYLRLGGLFEARFGGDDSGLTDDWWARILSFDVLVRGVVPFEVRSDLVVTPFVAVPIGLTVWVDGNQDVDESYVGANWGMLFGSELVVNGNLAPSLGLGFRWHRGNQGDDPGLEQYTLMQFELQLGFSYVFGG